MNPHIKAGSGAQGTEVGTVEAEVVMADSLIEDIEEMASRKGAARFPSPEQLRGWARMAKSLKAARESAESRLREAPAVLIAGISPGLMGEARVICYADKKDNMDQFMGQRARLVREADHEA